MKFLVRTIFSYLISSFFHSSFFAMRKLTDHRRWFLIIRISMKTFLVFLQPSSIRGKIAYRTKLEESSQDVVKKFTTLLFLLLDQLFFHEQKKKNNRGGLNYSMQKEKKRSFKTLLRSIDQYIDRSNVSRSATIRLEIEPQLNFEQYCCPSFWFTKCGTKLG